MRPESCWLLVAALGICVPIPLIAQEIDIDCEGPMASDPECRPGEPAVRGVTMVREAQTRLTLLGFEPGPADGIAGRRTLKALARFYHEHGLPARTRFDETTLLDLERALTGDAEHADGESPEDSLRQMRQLEEQLERARHTMTSDLLSTRNGAAAALARHARP